jgi:SAM-dependent methyltransferase
MYDFTWHDAHGAKTSASAKLVVPQLVRMLSVNSVLDVGCGDGRWLETFKAAGVKSVLGLDGPWNDKSKLSISAHEFVVHDLTRSIDLADRFDLAMSLEVAEHIGGEFADQFVNDLCGRSDVVLFGAAVPYQGGFRHINEIWQSAWAGKFRAAGFQVFDPFRAALWNRSDVHFWYKQNMLLYVRSARDDLVDKVESYMKAEAIETLPLDIIHPELYQQIASYSQIAFKPLLRQLPVQTARKVKQLLSGQV